MHTAIILTDKGPRTIGFDTFEWIGGLLWTRGDNDRTFLRADVLAVDPACNAAGELGAAVCPCPACYGVRKRRGTPAATDC